MKHKKIVSPFILMLLLFITCFSACKEKTVLVTPNGIWQQSGYGKIFEIKEDSVKIYDLCKVGCNVYDHILLANKGKVIRCTSDSMVIQKNIKTYRFNRLDNLPTLCNDIETNALSPEHNFEVLWHTFNENYCYFEQRNIDWISNYSIYKSKITNETSPLELYLLFDQMLSAMNDGHVSIEAPESLKEALNDLKKDSKAKKEIPQIAHRFELAEMIADRYCKDCKTYNAGLARWGTINQDIAYVQLNGMLFMADYDIPKHLSLNEFGKEYHRIGMERVFQRQDEIDGARQLFDSIFTDLNHSKALILDLRINTGGKDEVGLEMMGHFVKEKTKFASKKTKLGNGFTNHQDIYVESRLPFYDKPVYILTSAKTASASEAALLSTLSLGKVKRIGSATEGIFSDGLDKKLPNGWDYVMSNEVYLDINGNSYEGIGVSPHIDLKYPKRSAALLNTIYHQVKGSGDLAIEKVLELQENKQQ